MRLNLWTEIRTAAQVARLGRVSAAAEALGMHHSTAIRHIDALEDALKTKLFQRHARGYTPTEAGEELLRTSNMVIDQLSQMLDRIESSREEVTGQLIVTAIPIMDQLVLPIIKDYQAEHTAVQVLYHADVRTFHLAYGEAHVAFRAGAEPDHPDNVVTPLLDYRLGLYASQSYIRQHGRPETLADLAQHRFVISELGEVRAPFHRWLLERVPEDRITLRTSQSYSAYFAVFTGLGIGFLHPATAPEGMVELFPDQDIPEWATKIWLVTHVDLHRSIKVRNFTRLAQEAAKGWAR
ncbi:LysR family transcriptional regulator [Paracoccus aminophilus]|uniref:Transcriptional regulator, LysR family n=1 Tax=Paracoccus aminophilus JCM 7686 TaxID=1367847 RepID=S5YYT3_PARAH|nr:LysR family transcriptional regulator [Paracoccus aminophilus]AGT10381.1 transcriptional regulator, LysR family [Paracoccus aminophilus JCM 7686]